MINPTETAEVKTNLHIKTQDVSTKHTAKKQPTRLPLNVFTAFNSKKKL